MNHFEQIKFPNFKFLTVIGSRPFWKDFNILCRLLDNKVQRTQKHDTVTLFKNVYYNF